MIHNFLIEFIQIFTITTVLYMDNISSSIAITISLTIGVIVAMLVQLFLVPWQRQEITGSTQSGRVKFTINDSSESTPSGSPKRKQQQQQPRPSSFVQTDPKILPAITEQTELASFNNLSGVTPSFYQNDKTQQNGTRQHSIANGNCKIDPKYIEKAEHLLGNNRSLDNTDLTITSLNYIDEHHQTNGYLRSIIPRESLHNCFENQLNNHQFTSNSKQR